MRFERERVVANGGFVFEFFSNLKMYPNLVFNYLMDY